MTVMRKRARTCSRERLWLAAIGFAVCSAVPPFVTLNGQALSPQPTGTPVHSGVAQTAGISGRVLRVGSRAPITDAAVQLASTEPGGLALQTLTDRNGAFAFSDLAPGRYLVSASKPGYPAGGTIVGRRMNARTVVLIPSVSLDRVELQLSPGSAISGRVLDNEGAPVVRATVEAVRRLRANGRPLLWPVGASVKTDDQGRYRLSDIPSGRYLVRVTPQRLILPGLPVAEKAGVRSRPAIQVVTYYPAETSFDRAQPVALASDYEAAGCDVVVQTSQTFAIRGVLAGLAESQTAQGPVVSLESVEGSGVGRMAATVSRDGKFELVGVPAGRYTLRASVRDAAGKEGTWFATAEVLDQDLADFILPPLPEADVPGRVFIDSSAPETLDEALLRDLKVHLRPVTNPFAPGHEATWTVRNEFVVSSVFAGAWYSVTVQGLPSEYYIAGISYGQKDALRDTITITPGVTLDVRLGSGAATLTVRAKDAEAKSFADAYVLLVQDSDATDGVERWQEGSTADQHGEATFASLRPGRYRLYAFDGFDTSLLELPGALQRFDVRALKVELGEGKAHQLELTVIAFDQ
ncbi:MAG: carboxypeptidase regulatory-like domain-containing protein [Bryobacteraceae bacterium]